MLKLELSIDSKAKLRKSFCVYEGFIKLHGKSCASGICTCEEQKEPELQSEAKRPGISWFTGLTMCGKGARKSFSPLIGIDILKTFCY